MTGIIKYRCLRVAQRSTQKLKSLKVKYTAPNLGNNFLNRAQE